ncbi:MAG: hypothetical protein K2H01_07780 [Ruminococcus sp.]|nr:hypothetical protein [Ruminococcus sp.]
MNFRYQEILALIIPCFFLMSCTIGVWLYFYCHNQYIVDENWFNSLLNGLSSPPTTFWTAIATILVFLIPIMSMIVGWIVNAVGGYLMKISCLRKLLLSVAYKKSKCGEEEKEKCPDVVKKYYKIIRLKDVDKIDKLDRFYYRYVLSRNMLAAQLILIFMPLIMAIPGFAYPSTCRLVVNEAILALAFLFIMVRDFITHAEFVFRSSDK